MLLVLGSVTSNCLRRHLYQREPPNQVWVCLMSFSFFVGFFFFFWSHFSSTSHHVTFWLQ